MGLAKIEKLVCCAVADFGKQEGFGWEQWPGNLVQQRQSINESPPVEPELASARSDTQQGLKALDAIQPSLCSHQ